VYVACNFKVNGGEDSSEWPVKLYHTTRPYIPEDLLFHSENKGSTSPPPHSIEKFVTDRRALYSEENTFHRRGQ